MTKKSKNKQFDLLGDKLTVVYKDRVEYEDGHWIYGHCVENADTFTIEISTKDEHGKPVAKDSMRRTLRHELFHAILNRGQYFNSSQDEPMIEWLAICTDILNKQGLKI